MVSGVVWRKLFKAVNRHGHCHTLTGKYLNVSGVKWNS